MFGLQWLRSVFSGFGQAMVIGRCKMVIVVRKDIQMTPGKIAAQCSHAAVECYRQSAKHSRLQLLSKKWLLYGQPKIILKVYSEKEILDIHQRARSAGLVTAKIADAGHTQVCSGTITAVGIGPALIADIDKITSKLKIL